MTIHYTITKRDEYLYLLGEGVEEGLEEGIQIHAMILNACKEHNCPRVLIDDRNVTYTASVLSIYLLAKYYSEMDVRRYITRAAVLTQPENKTDNQFFENTMRNRHVNLRVFYDFEEAEKWLTT